MTTPRRIHLHKKSKVLELEYSDGTFRLSAEYLRVHSPSAQVRGHGKGNEVLQTGKLNVGILDVEAAGNYALRIVFDDGHDSGIYSWDYLYDLTRNEGRYWQAYLDRLEAEGLSRDPHTSVVHFIKP